MKFRLGVDLGGTKVAVAVLDDSNTAIFKNRAVTPAHDYNAILATIVGLVEEARDKAAIPSDAPIGIGIPGELDPLTNRVKNANTTSLIGKPLQLDLAERLSTKIHVANDATCFVASEAADGAAQNCHVAFGVILGTGVGGGIAFNSRPWRGANRIAGEWGHNSFPFFQDAPKNRQCYCGKIDCIEQILSGPALERSYSELSGNPKTANEIAELSSNGDAQAIQVIEEYYRNLAKALSTVMNMIDPEVIVLGGGLSNIKGLYDHVPKIWNEYVFAASDSHSQIVTKLVPNRWGDDSGVRGAAWLS